MSTPCTQAVVSKDTSPLQTPRTREQNGGCQGLEVGGGNGEMLGKRVQTSSYKMSKLWRSNAQHGDYN